METTSIVHPEEASLSLVLAVITSSHAPLLLLNEKLKVVAASTSFCSAFDIDPASVPGKSLSELGQGEWNEPQFTALLEATASGAAAVQSYELTLNRPKRPALFLILNAHRLDYDDKTQTRILLSVADVTEIRANAKLKDDLLHDKAVLLSEVQHRVANSLQIIASILMQSARKVQSDETRGHLKDAHSRLMSIAAVQRQLATSSLENVELRPYFAQLCSSLGASMIADQQVLSIEVVADESVTSANTSVSLGLIVTELVINALKHAFPEHRPGKIIVEYHATGPNWTMKVSDNGVGMPVIEATKPGLGTNIVEALAKSLKAEVLVEDAHPGTATSVVHAEVSSLNIAQAV